MEIVAALVVRGEAGIGKSTLLEYAVEAASDLLVMQAGGVESEMELAFAGLQQFSAPMLDRLERLPDPQREALGIVFGLSRGPAPDHFLVGLAVLSLLSEVAQDRPLLCVVDDVQWLDQASARTLGFVARRLRAEPVGLIFATRVPNDALGGLPELKVEGLRNGDARALLALAVPFQLDERIRDRIVEETGGNPLALLELPRGLTKMQLAEGFGLVGAQALPQRIEESFSQRLAQLSPETRQILLVAAAEPMGDPLLVWRAAERLGVSAAAVAETDGILTIAQRVTFRHPLARSAVYRSASPEGRRSVHLALAQETDPEADPDRRAWHLAAAAPGPDEEVAIELERSARRAQARGGLAAAAAFLQRSVALTYNPARRVDRALAAAQSNLLAGAFDSARGMLATAEGGSLNEFQLASLELLRGQIASASGAGSTAPSQLLKAARLFEALDVTRGRETYLDALGAALFAGRLAAAATLLEISIAAKSAPQPAYEPRPSDLLLDGLATLITEGRGVAAPILRKAISAFRGEEISVEKGLQWAVLASSAAVVLWDFDSWQAIINRHVELAREAGALTPLSIAMNGQGIVVTWCGEFAAAAAVIAEADTVTEATGTRVSPYGAMLLAAFQGDERLASSLIQSTMKGAVAGHEGLAVQYANWASAILYNGLGDYEKALTASREASEDTPQLFLSVWALPELIEAATRSGNRELADEAMERLAASTAVSDTDWGLGLVARSRALLSEGDHAQRLYLEAISRLSRTQLRPELGRAHLLYGEWLRREGKRLEAREQLRIAHDLFSGVGMAAFADRARHELLATGEKVRKRSVETRDDLTAQEEQIAWLREKGFPTPRSGLDCSSVHERSSGTCARFSAS